VAPELRLPKPAEISAFLLHTFPRVGVKSASDPYYRVDKVSLATGVYFRELHTLIATGGNCLERPLLPSGDKAGTFAYDARRKRGKPWLYYLNHNRPLELGGALRADGRSIEEAAEAVDALAELVADALLAQGKRRHTVVRSVEDVQRVGASFDLDPGELRKLVGVVRGPRLEPNARGADLTFHTVRGWMHERDGVARHVIRFDVDWNPAEPITQVLSATIFGGAPSLD